MKQIMAILMISVLNASAALAAEVPHRVVSMNVCTDQLAMLIAGAGQLYSVSYLAGDRNASVLADQAGGYVVNHGLAEEVFLMQPDLIIAGTFTTRTTVELLRRLGFRVEEFAPANSLDDIREHIARMGELLGRQEKAAELVKRIDNDLATLRAQPPSSKSVATYYANSYTSGSGTLVDALIGVSGLENVAARLGLTGTSKLPLELLLLANPDLIVSSEGDYAAPALAEEGYVHPAFKAVTAGSKAVNISTKYTICGAPFTLEAAHMLRDAAGAAK
ncbi:ABC transporter substrate-binding protein [Mesorhizobium sp. CGMCC 1.15528]|uniref:ABC transporter substrate-binding protein n=1 Tax=Mesorhizobium zhangyense TaxID=1776730 RepID=A0A7C9VFM0_9HYPH|nr:ABC transporter substrate-binding protein [Mesorhizobium zhangyense]NGN43208.1 ABC transporter substrate-binding protein [Mesorhizobium zhangyense]